MAFSFITPASKIDNGGKPLFSQFPHVEYVEQIKIQTLIEDSSRRPLQAVRGNLKSVRNWRWSHQKEYGIKTIIMTLAQRTLFVLAFAVAAGTAVYKAHQASSLVQQLQTVRQTEDNLRDENLQLRQELDRATKRMGLLSEEAAARQGLTETQVRLLPDPPRAAPPPTNLFARFQNGAPNLTAEQVKTFLMSGRTNAGRLLAAYRTSGDRSLLKDAVTKYPNNAQVTFEAVFDSTLPPEQQRQALDAFKQSAPDNALANYLSALDYFKSGQRDRAIEEFAAASTKRFDDYTLEREQDNQEAYLSAGYS
ncbi:MAG: hypothetical protein C5B50_08670, partial [Verrucomicrobia bacterium]